MSLICVPVQDSGEVDTQPHLGLCLVTPLIKPCGGQASAAVCAVCALQCVVYTSDQPACGVVCLWML